MTTASTLGTTVCLDTTFEDAVSRVTTALQSQGFGVLTEIDVQATLKKKLDVDHKPYKILGACNPPIAYRALTAAPEIGLLLPCNVTVRELESGQIEVSIIDPITMLSGLDRPELASLGEEARARLSAVADALR